MINVNVNIKIPDGDYCDVCTEEKIEEIYQKYYAGGVKLVRQRTPSAWDYACVFACGIGNGQSKCALFGSNLHNEKTPRNINAIWARSVKCKKCKAATEEMAITWLEEKNNA